MLRLVIAISVLFVSTSALAAPTVAVGKFTSTHAETIAIASLPMVAATVASVALPSKYRSKKNFLLIKVTTQEYCGGGSVFSTASVGGAGAQPDR